jgi:MFS family permease
MYQVNNCPFLRWTLPALIFLVGLASSIQVVCFVVGLQVSPEHAGGTALAGINMITMLLGGLFQPVAGYILDWSSGGGPVAHYSVADYRLSMLILPLMTLLSVFACLFLKESYLEEMEEEIGELAEEEVMV